jgi:thioredoxin reductase (NADPH)
MADEIRNGDSKARVIRLFGHRDDAGAWQIRDFWIELSTEEDFCRELGLSDLRNVNLPVVELPDGTRLFGPTLRDVADRLGFVTKPKLRQYDVSIYGAGPGRPGCGRVRRLRRGGHGFFLIFRKRSLGH